MENQNASNEKTLNPLTEKKPYKTPSFRFEPVFEVAALACGKVFSTQGSCRASRKAS